VRSDKKTRPAHDVKSVVATSSLHNNVTPRLLGITAAAEYMGATAWFVRTLVWNRAIPFCKLGKRLLLDRADLDAFVTSQKEPVPPMTVSARATHLNFTKGSL
jgi:excisionase family DNA binding protein